MAFGLLINNQEVENHGGPKCSVRAVHSCIPDEFTNMIQFQDNRILDLSLGASKIRVCKPCYPLREFIAALVEKQ